MAGFRPQIKDSIKLWRGDTTCQDGHDWLAARLKAMATPLGASVSKISVRVQGNLGEFMALCIGMENDFADRYKPFPANGFAPLVDVSRPDIDILWLRIGKDAGRDVLVVHEVKTTTDPKLGLARGLVSDHEKLFGLDPQLTLHSRLMWLANKVEYE